MLDERRPDRAAGAVAIVGQGFGDDRDAAGAIALITDSVVALGIGAGCFLDRAVDVVFRHILGACGLDGETQPRVHVRVGRAGLGRNRDLAADLGEGAGAVRILLALAMHDVLEL